MTDPGYYIREKLSISYLYILRFTVTDVKHNSVFYHPVTTLCKHNNRNVCILLNVKCRNSFVGCALKEYQGQPYIRRCTRSLLVDFNIEVRNTSVSVGNNIHLVFKGHS